jgi:hypothetical protein
VSEDEVLFHQPRQNLQFKCRKVSLPDVSPMSNFDFTVDKLRSNLGKKSSRSSYLFTCFTNDFDFRSNFKLLEFVEIVDSFYLQSDGISIYFFLAVDNLKEASNIGEGQCRHSTEDGVNSGLRDAECRRGWGSTSTGTYKPRLRVFDVANLSMKIDRCFESEVIRFVCLSQDYSKVSVDCRISTAC